MLLDEWDSEEAGMARAIGGGRGVGDASGDLSQRQSGRVRPREGAARAQRAERDPRDPGFGGMDEPDELDYLDKMETLEGVDDDAWATPNADAAVVQGRGVSDDGMAAEPAGSLGLCYRECGGDGVALALRIDGKPARFWVDEQAWCEWLAPRLAVQKMDQVPAALEALLGQWALIPLQMHAEAAGLGTVEFVGSAPASCPFESAPTLTVARPDAALTLRLLACPAAWVAGLAGTMEDRSLPLALPPVRVSLVAGWARLTRAQLAALRPGDGLVLEHGTRVEQGEAWLVTGRVLARIKGGIDDGCRSHEPDGSHPVWKIESAVHSGETMPDLTRSTLIGEPDDAAQPRYANHGADGADYSADDQYRHGAARGASDAFADDHIQFTAMVEVGRLTMSIDALRGLHKGQVLDIGHVNGQVALTVSGRTVATGSLLRVDDRLVMRIE